MGGGLEEGCIICKTGATDLQLPKRSVAASKSRVISSAGRRLRNPRRQVCRCGTVGLAVAKLPAVLAAAKVELRCR